MNSILNRILILGAAVCGAATAQDVSAKYDNIIRQVQRPGMPDQLEWDVSVIPADQQPSALEINPGGARFELHTMLNVAPFSSWLLDSKYVGDYVPIAQISISSEDTTWTQIPRTRADRPFQVNIILEGMMAPGEDVPEAATVVKVHRHVQSYGEGGTGDDIDRDQALLHTQSELGPNSPDTTTTMAPDGTFSVRKTLQFDINSVPGGDRTKVRGEERFSIFKLEDYQAPEQQLVSKYIQIWPMADGTISGIAHNDYIRFKVPAITLAANDLYPGSSVYAQVYKGEKRDDTVLNVDAFLVPGSHKSNPSVAIPWDILRPINDWDSVFTEDGRWTLELVTVTPFGAPGETHGIERLAFVSFDLNRTIEMNGSFTTVE